ncbi:HmuY family protein [Marinobacter sp. NSM]|uniref:HmuY family protein n=1 Tax=Marinobacter sp. NSM TaxID=3458004 RepID=UPI004036A060
MELFENRPMAVVLATLALTACGGGSDNSIAEDDADNVSDFSEQLLPAATETVYLNLETGAMVEEGGDWHIAANRLSFRVNSGASGTGSVVGALAIAQDDFYDGNGDPVANMFTNATANSEQEHLLGILEEPASWQEDAFASAFGASDTWSQYDFSTGVISEADDVGYLVRSAEGNSYARMRVVDFNFPTREGQGIEDFTLEFDVQASGASQFSTTPVTFTPPAGYDGGDVCFDFDSDAVVDCDTSDNWDVQVGFSGRDWYLKSNSGVSGAGKGGASDPMTWSELAANDSDPGVPQLYNTDSTGGVFTDNTWYAYNLTNQHKIWPNFRTFLIKAEADDPESAVWALQIVGYYDQNGTSGQPTVRWLPVELQQAEE